MYGFTGREGGIYLKKTEKNADFLSVADPVKLLVFVSQLHRRTIEKLVGASGLHRAQHRMLMTLADRAFDSQSELARMLDVSTATVAVSLKKLEREGYIRRGSKEDDSRANFIQLTARGEQIVQSSREIFEYIDHQAVKGFTDQELVLLKSYLRRIYGNLSEIRK